LNHLDPLMRGAVVPARLSAGAGTAVWAWDAGQEGMAALRSLLAALADHLVRRGTTRPGVCHAGPCRYVYVHRSRRYCCGHCNDRAAAAAYRRRRNHTPA
jgi:predicted RNA-binding Zn ribbon-like protein